MFSISSLTHEFVLFVTIELVSAVEQLMLEEFYEVEIDMHFKWRSSLQATEDRARHEMLA